MTLLRSFAMPIIILIIVLCVLRYFEIWRFAQMSWWWIAALMAFGFLWFEFIEPMLGLDKRKAHDVDEQRRKDRVKESFDKSKRK
jgi:small Trp-rich protein